MQIFLIKFGSQEKHLWGGKYFWFLLYTFLILYAFPRKICDKVSIVYTLRVWSKYASIGSFVVQKINCGEIFSRVVFLFVTMCGYPAMMPDPELDFLLPTDISIAMCMS